MKTRCYLWGIVCALMICNLAEKADAKSVFAVSDHNNSIVKAYKIDGDEIDYQANAESGTFDSGATGLCVWPSIELMFVTYEWSNMITWCSTKTLHREDDDEIVAEESNLAGIVADETNSVLYVLSRSYGHLYTYTYDEQEDTLVLVHPNDPNYPDQTYRELSGLDSQYTYGLALDEEAGEGYGLLFASNRSTTVRYYNTSTWELAGTVDTGRKAVGIDVDGNGFLYAGGWGEHDYLIRCDIDGDPNDPNSVIEKDLAARITGISIDRDTGLVYTTTTRTVGGNPGSVEVYDASGWSATDPDALVLTDTESDSDFSGPAGIAVGPLYKPNLFYIEKDDHINPNDDPNCLVPNDNLTYTICFDPNGHSDDNVSITDHLPWGVTLVLAVPDTGVYNSTENTYTWSLGDFDPNARYTLQVTVDANAPPKTMLTNYVEIEGDQSYSWASHQTPICCWGSDRFYVDDTATGSATGQSWANAYTDLQHALQMVDVCDCNEIWVAQGTYKPDDADDEIAFELIDDVDLYGGFVGSESSLDQRDDWLNNPTILSGDIPGTADSDEVVKGDGLDANTVFDGFFVTEGVDGIYLNDCDNLFINHCVIKDNSSDGIYCLNTEQLSIKNNFIYENGNRGIYFSSPDAAAVVRNNTIADNGNYGIYRASGTTPNISNCILWDNSDDLSGCTATYSCVQDDGDDNPLFVDAANDDYHIDPTNSPCLDTGDPNGSYSSEVDIDGFDRLAASGDASAVVDIGADEVIYPDCWNFPCFCHGDGASVSGPPYYGLPDGFVDTNDWPAYRDSFQKSYPDPDYNPCGDWTRDGTVNTDDWPFFRDNYQTAPPTDCPRGGVWPPNQQKGSGVPDPDYIEEMIDWLEKYQPPGWKEFIELLKKLS